ncbi:MAG: hypothetical protein ABIG95_00995 [Candidatus Woesearchaeota archaeon]
MAESNFFDSLEYLEPKCPECGTVLDWGISTRFDEVKEVHVCAKCGHILQIQ